MRHGQQICDKIKESSLSLVKKCN